MRYAILAAAAVTLPLGFGGAYAADLPPAPTIEVNPWSVSVFGGPSWLENADLNGTVNNTNIEADVRYNTGFIVGGSLGYAVTDWARAEVEIAYQNYSYDSARITVQGRHQTVDVNGDLSALTLMGNLWFGLNMLPVVGEPVSGAAGSLGVSPYFGGGIGVGFVDNTVHSSPIDDNSTTFAWQVGAGIRWNFAPQLGMDIGYRFRGLTDVSFEPIDSVSLYSNNLIIGLTYSF
ncbi:MAG: outer membrane beta-barrel protein [Hyphomicrobiales bacterium]